LAAADSPPRLRVSGTGYFGLGGGSSGNKSYAILLFEAKPDMNLRIDVYTKVVLTVIAVALTTLALHPFLTPQTVAAQEGKSGPWQIALTHIDRGLNDIVVLNTITGQYYVQTANGAGVKSTVNQFINNVEGRIAAQKK